MKPEDILNKPNVISVQLGTKVTGGVDTGETCHKVTVAEKKDVPEEDKIPSEIDGVKTDVVKGDLIFAHAIEPTNTTGLAATNHGDKFDMLKGGISIGRLEEPGAGTGTLAGFAKSAKQGVPGEDGLLYGITNNHVVGVVYDQNRSSFDEGAAAADHPNKLLPDGTVTNLVQPGLADGGTSSDIIGDTGFKIDKVYPLILKELNKSVSLPFNYVDAAAFVTHAASGRIESTQSYDGGPLGVNPNTCPIFDFSNFPLTDNNNYEIIKIGRTTGRSGVLSDSVEMANSGLSYIPAKAVSGTGINVVFAGDGATSYTVTGTFIDAIKVWYPITGAGNRATRQDFSKAGDSGSMAYIKWDGQWYILGLVFAGIDPETGQSESYICRIDYVMKALQIGSHWTPDDNTRHDFSNLDDVRTAWGKGKLWDGDIVVAADSNLPDIFALKDGAHAGGKNNINSIYYKNVGFRKSPDHPQKTFPIEAADISAISSADELKKMKVTVAPHTGGGVNAYFINDVERPVLNLKRGVTYSFDLTEVSASHPFAIVDPDAADIILQNANGTEVDVFIPFAAGAKNRLEYHCQAHANMGNDIKLDLGYGLAESSSSSKSSSSSSSRSSTSSRSSFSSSKSSISSSSSLQSSSSSSKSSSSESSSKSSKSSSSESESSSSISSKSSSSMSSSSSQSSSSSKRRDSSVSSSSSNSSSKSSSESSSSSINITPAQAQAVVTAQDGVTWNSGDQVWIPALNPDGTFYYAQIELDPALVSSDDFVAFNLEREINNLGGNNPKRPTTGLSVTRSNETLTITQPYAGAIPEGVQDILHYTGGNTTTTGIVTGSFSGGAPVLKTKLTLGDVISTLSLSSHASIGSASVSANATTHTFDGSITNTHGAFNQTKYGFEIFYKPKQITSRLQVGVVIGGTEMWSVEDSTTGIQVTLNNTLGASFSSIMGQPSVEVRNDGWRVLRIIVPGLNNSAYGSGTDGQDATFCIGLSQETQAGGGVEIATDRNHCPILNNEVFYNETLNGGNPTKWQFYRYSDIYKNFPNSVNQFWFHGAFSHTYYYPEGDCNQIDIIADIQYPWIGRYTLGHGGQYDINGNPYFLHETPDTHIIRWSPTLNQFGVWSGANGGNAPGYQPINDAQILQTTDATSPRDCVHELNWTYNTAVYGALSGNIPLSVDQNKFYNGHIYWCDFPLADSGGNWGIVTDGSGNPQLDYSLDIEPTFQMNTYLHPHEPKTTSGYSDWTAGVNFLPSSSSSESSESASSESSSKSSKSSNSESSKSSSKSSSSSSSSFYISSSSSSQAPGYTDSPPFGINKFVIKNSTQTTDTTVSYVVTGDDKVSDWNNPYLPQEVPLQAGIPATFEWDENLWMEPEIYDTTYTIINNPGVVNPLPWKPYWAYHYGEGAPLRGWKRTGQSYCNSTSTFTGRDFIFIDDAPDSPYKDHVVYISCNFNYPYADRGALVTINKDLNGVPGFHAHTQKSIMSPGNNTYYWQHFNTHDYKASRYNKLEWAWID